MAGINCTIIGSNFIKNTAKGSGGGVHIGAQFKNENLTNCIFTDNNANNGGAICVGAIDTTISNSTFTGNTATANGGAVYWGGANSNMSNCNFTDNHAIQGDNVWWYWTVNDFLNKYNQINDDDYVLIKNGVGTPSRTIVLNKKGVTISSEGNVIFDAKGGNLHFEVTGDNVLIEKITFRNFNFTTNGGAILWNGNNGTLKNCNFINNTARAGAGVCWNGTNGVLIDSTFNSNMANINAAVYWSGYNGILTNCNFTNNTAGYGGAGVLWNGHDGTLTDCTFNGNKALIYHGGGVYWSGYNGILTNCNFTNNIAGGWGGAVGWWGRNGNLSYSIFNNNIAGEFGGAILWNIVGYMFNCSFYNSTSQISNGIYAVSNLTIAGGKGIVDLRVGDTLSGISIIVLNNETYYYPPNTNINLPNKNSMKQ